MINYEHLIKNGILLNDCPEHWGLINGASESECERGNMCYECWYRALALCREGKVLC